MNKFKRISVQLSLVAALVAVPFFVSKAFSQSNYFSSKGCSAVGCHVAPVAATCNGCHAHGAHPSSAKSSINVAGATNKATYAPGETVTVTITGGYRSGWFRAVLYDQNTVEISRSSGNASGMGSSATYPATLSAPAPLTPGAYTWKVAWYGNYQFAGTGAAFGAGWVVDATNANHGYEIVNTNSFTVAAVAAAPTISSVVPNSLPQGAVSQNVTITGTNLTGGTVSFSNAGVSGGAATVTATSITLPVSVTAGAAAGAGTVTVTTAGGSISSAFTVTAAIQNTLSVTITGPGSVNSNIAGIACTSGTCTAPYDSTASVILTETPGSASTFAGWGGDCLSFGTATACTVSMSAARNVSATFNSSAQAMIGSTPYATLAAAYSAATSGATIMLLDGNMAGNLTVDKDVVLDGGYNAAFTVKSGQPTALSGILTVGTGSLTVADIAVM